MIHKLMQGHMQGTGRDKANGCWFDVKIHTNFILGKILSTSQNMSPFSKSVIRVPAQNLGNIYDS